jgi:hypothetical protein
MFNMYILDLTVLCMMIVNLFQYESLLFNFVHSSLEHSEGRNISRAMHDGTWRDLCSHGEVALIFKWRGCVTPLLL